MNDPYVYPGTTVLTNKFGIFEQEHLEAAENKVVTERFSYGVPKGDFDLGHLQAIHKHLFQDIYEWAGEIRTVEINKAGSQFQLRRFITTGMSDVHHRLVKARFLCDLSVTAFASHAAEIIGDINHVHPFRDGNGRTQLLYLKQLADQAKHSVDLAKLEPEQWYSASKEAHFGRYDQMALAIRSCVAPRDKQKEHGRGRQL